MKKKATVLVALISMCLIATAGIGAVSASIDPVATVTAYKINPDGTTTLVKTLEGSTSVMMTLNEDGTVNIESEDDGITTIDTLKPSERIEASARTTYYKASATNYQLGGWTCSITSSSLNIGVSAEAGYGYLRCVTV